MPSYCSTHLNLLSVHIFPHLEHHGSEGLSDDVECLECARHWGYEDENIAFAQEPRVLGEDK